MWCVTMVRKRVAQSREDGAERHPMTNSDGFSMIQLVANASLGIVNVKRFGGVLVSEFVWCESVVSTFLVLGKGISYLHKADIRTL